MIELLTTEELVTELGKRFDTVVVITDKSLDASCDESLIHYRGNLCAALGLCLRGQHWLTEGATLEPMDMEEIV